MAVAFRRALRGLAPLLLIATAVAVVPRITGAAGTGGTGGPATTSTTATTATTLPPAPGAPRSVAASLTGTNGRTRIERSLGCSAGGDADYWHLQTEAALPPGVLTGPQSTLPGDLRLLADVHSPHHAIRATPEPVPGPTANAAFLLPGGSHVALSNARGTIKLGLASGSCGRGGQTLSFDGTSAAGPGTWQVTSATGSYRQAAGSGTFALDANVSPGADNPWRLDLQGTLAVLQPAIGVQLVETFWGRDGVDYAKRQVGVVYDVTNIGAGDSYGTVLKAASSPTPGASLLAIIVNGDNLLIDGNTPVGTFPRSLGDLASGETARVTLKWQLPLPANNPPCGAVILGCAIDTTLTFTVPDAMDVALSPDPTVTLRVKAPNLPPPA